MKTKLLIISTLIGAAALTGCASNAERYERTVTHMPGFDRGSNLFAKASAVYCPGREVLSFGALSFSGYIVCQGESGPQRFTFKVN